MTAKSNMGAILLAVTEKRHCLGAELELQQAHGLAENQIPLDMLRVEQRAAGVTTAPTNVGTSQAEIVQPVFANGAGALLGNYSTNHTPQAILSSRSCPLARMWEALTATRSDVPETDSAPSTPTSWLLSVFRPAQSTAAKMPQDSPRWIRRCGWRSTPGLEEKLDYEVSARDRGIVDGKQALKSQQDRAKRPTPSISHSSVSGASMGAIAAEQSDIKVLMGSGIVRARGAPPIRPRRTYPPLTR